MASEKESDYVTLVSNDGYTFVVRRSAAYIADVLKRALSSSNGMGFREAEANTYHCDTINGLVLEKVCEYLYYHEKHKDSRDVPDMDIPPELCLELLMAADYLNGIYATPGISARLY
ncbi:Elongin-C [Pseudocercospora fuligena]|uniref:Elongin-C n=1 Tax=Pseudocercospora fuligena TaxID=685502 RepID=A0A8H6RQN6_9PEZI|nr:Elongin-C [Pseudocercospora fuligena]